MESQFRESSPAYVFLQHLLDLPEFMEESLCSQEPGENIDFLSPENEQAALYVCSACPVLEGCRKYVLSFDNLPQRGVWAGEEYPEK